MCRDVSVSVTQQNLAGFVWHTSGSKTPAKCMFQIMHKAEFLDLEPLQITSFLKDQFPPEAEVRGQRSEVRILSGAPFKANKINTSSDS